MGETVPVDREKGEGWGFKLISGGVMLVGKKETGDGEVLDRKPGVGLKLMGVGVRGFQGP